MQQAGGDVVCATHVTVPFSPDSQSATPPAPTPAQDAAARQQIDAVEARVQAGEDFTTIASTFADPTTGASGGDFGCFVRGSGQVPTAFEDAAYSQPVGVVGDPVRSELGYHIILVRSRGVLPYEEAHDRIRQQLEQQQESPVQGAATDFLKQSTIEVDPRFGTFDMDQASVVPPDGPSAPAQPTDSSLVQSLTGADDGSAQSGAP
jgi:hypothetical protein